jgi:acyl-CoA synthetase
MSSQVEFATRGKSLGNLEISEETTKVQLCWKVDLSKCIDATPLVVKTSVSTSHNVEITQSTSHVVFVGSHSGIFVAVDLESGDEIWRRKFPDRIEGSAAVSFCGKFVFVGEICFVVYLDFSIYLRLNS